ncbi:MAG: putative drug exporter of the superfamily [Mycobacterium sp.]
MLRRVEADDLASSLGAFGRIGRFVVRRPLFVIGLWIALAVALFLLFPPLAKIAGEKQPEFLPSDAPVLVANNAMIKAFDESDSQNSLLVVLTNENGLGPEQEAVYRKLVDNLRADHQSVVMLQDFITTPALRDVVTSKDHKAWYLPVGLAGELATPPAAESYKKAVEIVKASTTGTTLTAHLTGPAATVGDMTAVGETDVHVVEIATALMVLTILLLVYRNPLTMALPLVMIGISLVVAQQLIAGLLELGLTISPQAMVLVSGMMLGAGTDYAVFLISRYHEYLRMGEESDAALVRALGSIGKVIAASAGTVAITFMGMTFAKLGVFSTIGPALAVTIFVGFLASITLLPAMLALAGRRGLCKPRRELTSRLWRRSGVRIVKHPIPHLVASLIVLAILAGCVGAIKFNYDDRKNLPADVDSNVGYAVMAQHFPVNSSIQQFILVKSPRDLRSPKALADLEQMARRVSQVPGIAAVRGITRPTGDTLEQAKATFQAGAVGDKLSQASTEISSRDADLDRLTGGAHQLADALGDVRNGVLDAMTSVSGLTNALVEMQAKYGPNATIADIDQSARLVKSMRAMGDALGVNLTQVDDVYRWAVPMMAALNFNPVCSIDPACQNSRAILQRLITAHDDGTLQSLSALAQQLQTADATQPVDGTVAQLRQKLEDATEAAQKLGLDRPDGIQRKLNELQNGANTLADASRQLADGVQLLVDQVRQMGPGLGDASSFLMAMRNNAREPSMAGFYIPPQILTNSEFKTAATMFVSGDGHAVRYLVQTDLDPFGTQAMDQVAQIMDAARSAQPNTELAGATISIAGLPAVNADVRDYYNHDMRFILTMTILVVLLILIVLLRAVVAPLYLIASVAISFLSALGIGVVVFQFILGQHLAWNVPGTAFIVLVAVGADYNLLLISRIRDEASRGMRTAVIRTVGATGGVITSAGIIFAASMFGLTFGSIAGMVQVGFIIGVGLLLDTFLVRTVTVPALAVIIGKANWWPAKNLKPLHGELDHPRAAKARNGADGDEREDDDKTDKEPQRFWRRRLLDLRSARRKDREDDRDIERDDDQPPCPIETREEHRNDQQQPGGYPCDTAAELVNEGAHRNP